MKFQPPTPKIWRDWGIVTEPEKVLPFDFPDRIFMQNEGNVSGSTFFFMGELPPVLASADDQTSASNKVLVFSREMETRRLLRTLLEMWGYTTDAPDSLDATLSGGENQTPKAILLDSILPFEAHLENIRKIRRNKFLKETPIIVISGFSQPEFRNLSLEVGANDFFVKPLDFDALEDYLKKNVDKSIGTTH